MGILDVSIAGIFYSQNNDFRSRYILSELELEAWRTRAPHLTALSSEQCKIKLISHVNFTTTPAFRIKIGKFFLPN